MKLSQAIAARSVMYGRACRNPVTLTSSSSIVGLSRSASRSMFAYQNTNMSAGGPTPENRFWSRCRGEYVSVMPVNFGYSPRRSCLTPENGRNRSLRSGPPASCRRRQKLWYQLRNMCGYTSSSTPSAAGRDAMSPPSIDFCS
jgi:hypothetical protein